MAPYFYCLPVCAGCGIIVLKYDKCKSKKSEVKPVYGLSDRLKPLSAAEEQVLLALWDCPAPATRRDISEKLTATG